LAERWVRMSCAEPPHLPLRSLQPGLLERSSNYQGMMNSVAWQWLYCGAEASGAGWFRASEVGCSRRNSLGGLPSGKCTATPARASLARGDMARVCSHVLKQILRHAPDIFTNPRNFIECRRGEDTQRSRACCTHAGSQIQSATDGATGSPEKRTKLPTSLAAPCLVSMQQAGM
jgi:hypothetical protein